MLHQGLTVLRTGFYPFGNTPAVCLTQNLPPKAPANILILGCGDLRNVLFTNHSEGGRRSLDFTCCDIEAAVIARGILLKTLLIDDTNGQQNTSNWNIYFHQYLNPADHSRLVTRAKKLCSFSASLDAWKGGQYGNMVRFCDRSTVHQVSKVWNFYLDESNRPQVEAKMESEKIARPHLNMSGLRSTAPTYITGYEAIVDAHQNFWKHGSTDTDLATMSKNSKFPNPMLVSPRIAAQLHGGENPLLGFHLAAAFVPLHDKCPYAPASKQTTSLQKAVVAARTEFRLWSESFRKHAKDKITLRYFVGDGIAFAHALQHRRLTGSVAKESGYRTRFESFDPLILNEAGYGVSGDAPVSFTTIDTSNLIDHVGSINLLVATSPLLDERTSSTLYTESLVKTSETHQAFIQNLFGTHLGFFSLLLGLFPVDYWTNTTSVCAGDEEIIDKLNQGAAQSRPKQPPGQLHNRMGWKRPPGAAHFGSENIEAMRSAFGLGQSAGPALPVYCRANFAMLLRFVKTRVKTNWTAAMSQLLSFIINDTSLAMGSNYNHELVTYMHTLDVLHAAELMEPLCNLPAKGATRTNLSHWEDMPSTHSLGTKWMNTFAAVQLGFGTIKTLGSPYTINFSLQIEDDPEGWYGSSPLLVSFRVPSWILLQEPKQATIAFSLQHTAAIVQMHSHELGPQLEVFRAKLGDASLVSVTKEPPNLKETTTRRSFGFGKADFVDPGVLNPGSRSTIMANTDGTVTTLTYRIDLKSPGLKSALNGGCVVKNTAVSSSVWDVKIGDKSTVKVIFPLPMLESSIKTRIARKPSYIEVFGTVNTEISKAPSFHLTYPTVFSNSGRPGARPIPAPWNMPHINFSTLPAINIDPKHHASLSWVDLHLSHMFSSHEKLLRQNPRQPVSKEARAREAEGIQMVLLVSAMRLDLSNRTLVLDAAVMPASFERLQQQAMVFQHIFNTEKITAVNVTLDELRLWKEVLPSMVERCREWEHKAGCEYFKGGKAKPPPLSVEKGGRIICDCGQGVFPADYHVDYLGSNWKHVKKQCVRAAISPMFASSLVVGLS
ncbi:hypothetical protein QBC35DRAFT_517620 [Podospora australis]|uniref:DUF4470 domain-containing protein n=1 Tax=Podospora australis TaxID=1536484 RepID=A0AAN6WQ66_9PEZI|nr:hypothetical protein QBC35DRAFT_517620 [Podospora australis]